MGESVAAARDVSHVTKLRSYKRVLGPSPHVFKSLPTSYRLIHRFCNYTDKRNSDSVSMSYLVWDIKSIPTFSTWDSGIRLQETDKGNSNSVLMSYLVWDIKSIPTSSTRDSGIRLQETDKRNSDSVSMSYLVWDIESIPTSSTRDSGIRSQETVKLACKALTVLSKHQIFLDIIFYSPQTSPLLFFPPKSTVCYPGNVVSEDIHP